MCILTVDQAIDERFRPDIENASEHNSWRKSVKLIEKLYEPHKDTPTYLGRCTGIVQHHTKLESISRCLNLHYVDKRDLTTLEYQMTTLVQGNNTIQEFYWPIKLAKFLGVILDSNLNWI